MSSISDNLKSIFGVFLSRSIDAINDVNHLTNDEKIKINKDIKRLMDKFNMRYVNYNSDDDKYLILEEHLSILMNALKKEVKDDE